MWHACEALQPAIAAMYRQLHRIPEVGKHLPKTSAFVRQRLEQMGVPYVLSKSDDSILATIHCGSPGKTLLLRADMDALEIHEETGLPYASCHPGKMHACGHDAHTAMLLGAGEVLYANRDRLAGTVKLLFQTDEESVSGAEPLIDQGWLDGVDAVFGLHIGSILGAHIPSGTMVAAPGCCMASVDHFRIDIQGKGCHGSSPEKGVDPIAIAAHIILALQNLPAREVAAREPIALTLGSIHGGSQTNIIPDQVQLLGSLRCVSPDTRKHILDRMDTIIRLTAQSFLGSAELKILSCAPALINDPACAELAANSCAEVVGSARVITHLDAPNMGSEDFACYLQKAPGAFLFLSSADADLKTDIPHHNAKFQIDEGVLWQGSASLVAIAQQMLT